MLELKIGKHTYTITSEDRFLDNGRCVQLLTQSEERGAFFGSWLNPVLSKVAVKKIGKYTREQQAHGYSTNVTVFSLVI